MNGNGKTDCKLEKLRKKEAALKAAIAALKVTQQKREEQNVARTWAIVGEAVCVYGSRTKDFGVMLRQVLSTIVTDERKRKHLVSQGWV